LNGAWRAKHNLAIRIRFDFERSPFKFGRSTMHISEGVLSGPVLLSGAALAAAGTAIGLKKLDYDQIAKAGMLSGAFFVASLVHVPLGPMSVHLIMNGLVGLLLGWAAFPAILVALALQAVFFQFGGITALGQPASVSPAVPRGAGRRLWLRFSFCFSSRRHRQHGADVHGGKFLECRGHGGGSPHPHHDHRGDRHRPVCRVSQESPAVDAAGLF
jgi:hypothetical protein